jgi:hypothetical protein
MKEKLAPRARFELATLRLTAECSTVELPGNTQAGLLFYSSLYSRATRHKGINETSVHLMKEGRICAGLGRATNLRFIRHLCPLR